MRQRLGNVFDQIEEQIENDEQWREPYWFETERRSNQLVQPATETLDLDAIEDHQPEHGQRQREGRVDVRRGHTAPLVQVEHVLIDPRHYVDGQKVHRVHQE